MKHEDDVILEIRAEVLRLWEDRVKASTERIPHNCTHNHRQPLDLDSHIEGELNPGYNRIQREEPGDGKVHLRMIPEIGICLYKADSVSDWAGTICDEPVDAARCPYFTPTETTETLWSKFLEDISNPLWVGKEAPRLSALLWVIDKSPKFALTSYLPPWWVRAVWRRLFQVKTPPAQSFPALGEFVPDVRL